MSDQVQHPVWAC